jgi:hypothetical protein
MEVTARQADEFPGRICSWRDLTDLVEHFSYFSAHDWLFRGITDLDHALIPKVGRPDTRAVKENPSTKVKNRVPYRLEDERAVFQMFKQQGRSYLASPPATDLEWLAVAQHFGLPTRLLDWTESLLVATWFAVEKSGAKSNKANAAIWVTRGVKSIDPFTDTDPFAVDEPQIYRPAHVSPRIAAQASVLMICPNPVTAATLNFAHRITISREVEFLLKKRLNACGMNKRLLFPELSGLADHLAWLHKQDYLAGYRERNDLSIEPTPDDSPEDE